MPLLMPAPVVAQAPSTHPHMRPATGTRHTPFTLHLTLGDAVSTTDSFTSAYRVSVSPPAGCAAPAQPAPVTDGAAGDHVKRRLQTPDGGWCRGRYRIAVEYTRAVVCQPDRMCPAIAFAPEAAGSTHFTVHRTA